MGLYPDTTSFYQATVVAAPLPGTGMGSNGPGAKSGGRQLDPKAKKGKYILMFVDDGNQEWEVDALDVVPVSLISYAVYEAANPARREY